MWLQESHCLMGSNTACSPFPLPHHASPLGLISLGISTVSGHGSQQR